MLRRQTVSWNLWHKRIVQTAWCWEQHSAAPLKRSTMYAHMSSQLAINTSKLQNSWLDGGPHTTILVQTVSPSKLVSPLGHKLDVCGSWWVWCQNNAHSAYRYLPSPALCADITLLRTDSSVAVVKDQGGGLEDARMVSTARSSSDWHQRSISGITCHRQRHIKMYFEKNAAVHTGLPWMLS